MTATARSLLPLGRAQTLLDVAVVLWVATWIALGAAISGEVRGLRQLSLTVTRVGAAVQQTGQTLQTLGSVPLVGGRVADAARSIDAAGASTVQSGRQSRASIQTLTWMLGLFVAVIPAVAVLGFYVPLRVATFRDRRALGRLLTAHGDDPALRRILAERALLTTPYRHLLGDSALVEDASGERLDELARAELARLGLAPTASR